MTRMEKHRIQMEERKEQKKVRLKAQAELRRKQAIEGLSGTRRITADNTKSEYMTYSEEIDARQEMAKDYLMVLQRSLPGFLIRLSKVKDYRNPKKTKHKVAVILLLGIFWFVFQKSSRREANEELTNPIFIENMRLFFPDLESLPHHDTGRPKSGTPKSGTGTPKSGTGSTKSGTGSTKSGTGSIFYDSSNEKVFIITAYEPDLKHFEPGFKISRKT